jgi:hypothetical protein
VLGILDAQQVAFTMVCPFHVALEGETAQPLECGAFLIVSVRPHSLAVEAAEEIVYQLYQVLSR